jgi:hypothetical protein
VTGRVDLLGDDLVRVERAQAPVDVSLHDALNPAVTTPTRPTRGACNICREKEAAERCLHCEQVVCREHFWIMLGLCKSCATEEELEKSREGPTRPPPDLDIKWVED